MTPPRIGSLFTGVGGLDLAVEAFFDAGTAWHCQYEPPNPKTRKPDPQFAALVLANHWPGVPNLGDVTQVNWDQVEPVDILTGGFPCTDVSLAGKRAGLNDQTRSGLWAHMARAISVLRPNLVVIENVRGLLSAPADGDVEPCPWCLGDRDGEPALRALGAVLGDLAGLGFDAEWIGLPASGVGACHERFRIFILAWPAHAEGPRLEDRREGRPGRGAAAPADAASVGRGEGRTEPARLGGRLSSAPDWGAYAPAIDRWARIVGRPAPRPVDDRGRLAPPLVEWMMGLPDGWFTAVPAPGLTESQLRNAQLKAGGNGVVPRQAYAALAELWARATTLPAAVAA